MADSIAPESLQTYASGAKLFNCVPRVNPPLSKEQHCMKKSQASRAPHAAFHLLEGFALHRAVRHLSRLAWDTESSCTKEATKEKGLK